MYEDLYIYLDDSSWAQVYNILKNCFNNYYTVLKFLLEEGYNIKNIIDNINNIDVFLAEELIETHLHNLQILNINKKG